LVKLDFGKQDRTNFPKGLPRRQKSGQETYLTLNHRPLGGEEEKTPWSKGWRKEGKRPFLVFIFPSSGLEGKKKPKGHFDRSGGKEPSFSTILQQCDRKERARSAKRLGK